MNNNSETATPVTEDEMDDIRVTLNTDDGDIECKILTIFEVDGRDYIALIPLDENDQENDRGEIYFYRYAEDENGIPALDMIEDDEEYDAVFDRFDELQDEALFDEMDD